MFAALTGRLVMVEFLIAAKADGRAVDKVGKTALLLAEQQGSQDVVARLKAALAGGWKCRGTGQSPGGVGGLSVRPGRRPA